MYDAENVEFKFSRLRRHLKVRFFKLTKATITRCDLSPRFFCIDASFWANLKAIRYESTSLNRIVADKSHRVIVAKLWELYN